MIDVLRAAVTMPYVQFTGAAVVLLLSLLILPGDRRR
jgi:hypothetical protein